ncbi:MAG TPA: hypothetical protein VFO10_14945 [Oligoflexus sp.]|uniref:hypothetical protein n=1 Tax=Oligoflexus sp. TaxID=1971216 RepID=UPI002D7F309E|nr:hypothetical protein [Oligoflexus sp.]HET9238556.1 hypothetical protein [Oligoflexus sp.]
MKLIHLPMLGLFLAAAAPAADLSMNKVGALLQKPLEPQVYRLGLDYVQADSETEQRVITRRLNLAIGLPARFEFGFALLDVQEPAVDHSSKPLGGKVWVKWNMLQSSIFNAGATLQYQPGLAGAESFYQASQDRTSFGLDMSLAPFTWMEAAVYGNYSRRKDERLGALVLGDESVVGARLSLGTVNYGIYGDASQRHLTEESRKLFAREWEAGLYLGTDGVQLKTFALIPDTHRYFGMPERGFGASLTMTIGGTAKPLDLRDQPGDALEATNRAERAAASEQSAKAPVEAGVKILETNELDEFQLLEKKAQDNVKNQQETAAEKAERELRESLEAEKKMAAQKVLDDEKARREAAEAYQKRVQDDQDAYNEYKDDVNEEVNRYTLPDQEDLNWNGLTP